MKTDELMDAITELDDDLLNEAAGTPSPEEIRAAKRAERAAARRKLIFRAGAAAALITLVLLLAPVFGNRRNGDDGKTPASEAPKAGGIIEAPHDSAGAKLLAQPQQAFQIKPFVHWHPPPQAPPPAPCRAPDGIAARGG